MGGACALEENFVPWSHLVPPLDGTATLRLASTTSLTWDAHVDNPDHTNIVFPVGGAAATCLGVTPTDEGEWFTADRTKMLPDQDPLADVGNLVYPRVNINGMVVDPCNSLSCVRDMFTFYCTAIHQSLYPEGLTGFDCYVGFSGATAVGDASTFKLTWGDTSCADGPGEKMDTSDFKWIAPATNLTRISLGRAHIDTEAAFSYPLCFDNVFLKNEAMKV